MTVAVLVQAFASFTVIVNGPAARFENTFEAWNVVPSFEYVKAPVPPPAVAVMVPVAPPLQSGFVLASVSVMAGGLVSVTGVAVAVAATASLTVIVYGPASRPENTFEAWNVVPSFENVYGAVPPVAVAVMVPVAPPLQSGFVLVTVTARAAPAAVSVMLAVLVQAFASLTVIVYGPAARPENTFEAWNVVPSFE